MSYEKELARAVKQLDDKISYLVSKRKHWVRVIVIQKLTGWDGEFMRLARDNNMVEWRKTGDQYEYLVESIPENCLLKKAS